jgi:hypothetical protein
MTALATRSPFDELIDLAHDAGFCGCVRCPRAGLTWGRVHGSDTHHWIAAVLPGAKPGEVIRVEEAASSLDWAARTLIWKHLIHDPASTLKP